MTKYIKRHDVFARTNHWMYAVFGIALIFTGLFIFVRPLGDLIGPHGVAMMSVHHRIAAVPFVLVPILSWLIRPSNFTHTMKNLFMKWDDDDKEFMIKFFPYLLNPKKHHMPKQQFVKSGQRFSDIIMYLCIFGISISGIFLWVGAFIAPTPLYAFWRLIHNLCFFGIGAMFPIHVFFGAGIFQPYRRLARVMFGDGYVSESDALYHWGHWAEEELRSGKNIKVVEHLGDAK